jgi:hypothetical protein
MDPHRSVRMDLMSSRDVQKYLAKNDMVILPVGCFEMHGPDIPLACDSFVAWAHAILLAEVWHCVTLPPVYYTYPGATGPWPGTVDVPVGATQGYITAIIEALVKNGFKRIVLFGTHAPLRWMMECVVRDVFQRTGTVVVFLGPGAMMGGLVRSELGYEWGEDAMVLGALKILGLHGSYDPSCKVTKPGDHPHESMKRLAAMGAVLPWTYNRDYQHTGLRTEVKLEHADKIVKAMRKAALRVRDLPATFATYQRDMKKQYADRPWSKSGIWTRTR